MSIQPASVVRRIVEDARANPRADFVFETLAPEAFHANRPRQRITWLRAPAGSFTTEFEFWAHALRVWLEQSGVPERLEAVVGNALCRPVAEAELRQAVDARLAGSRIPRRLELAGSFTGAYHMIEHDVLESFAIETDAELAAFFWEDLDWL
jgi:hypothetical protein